MKLPARELMTTDFVTIRPEALISEAARLIFHGKIRPTGYKPFGIMVTDDFQRLVGMISMHDILYHLRPPFMNYDMEHNLIWEDELEPYMDKFKELTVEQIMSTPVVTASPEDHFIVLIDRMIKTGARRIPVVEGDKILGIVYLSDVFHRLCSLWLD